MAAAAKAARRYWLMKSVPTTYSYDDLERDGVTCWEGVRNYQARNFMRDDMRVGDDIFFYHSSASPAGIVGLARVSKAAYPDHFAWDTTSDYVDPKASPENPIWVMVDVEPVERFAHFLPIGELRETAGLEEMLVLRRGMRLSIQPVERSHAVILKRVGRQIKKG